VLVALYFHLPFFAGDDSQGENHDMAAAFDRTPAAIDRQWRNIQDVEKGRQVQNVGQAVIREVERYLADEPAGRARALSTCDRRGWSSLRSLLR
jgi:hypothetical protein